MPKEIKNTPENHIFSLWQSSDSMLQDKKAHVWCGFINYFLLLKYLIRCAKYLQLKLASVKTI